MTGLVIVGGSRAGLYAAEGARRVGYDGSIVLVGDEPHLPYDRPPLSKDFLSPEAEPAVPHYRTLEALESTLGLDVVTGARATALDTEQRQVWLGGESVEYEALVIATGAAARELPATAGMSRVVTLRSLDDAWRLRAAFERRPRTVVVGAGLIGSEVASAARLRGLDVTVVEPLSVPLCRVVGEQSGQVCAALHERHGTALVTGVSVTAIAERETNSEVLLSDGTRLEAELVVVGIGATPGTGWLEGSGLDLDDGLVCDATLGAGAPGVFGAGDVVRWPNGRSSGRGVRLETWTSAAEQGRIAGRNAVLTDDPTTFETVPYVWSDQYGCRIQFVGEATPIDEIVSLDDDASGHSYLALHGRQGLLSGAFGLNQPRLIPKLRTMIIRGTTLCDAVSQLEPLVSDMRPAPS
jgi:NADPH-dependent 2,4-dienoyl-CoA reductase/sulfur reductase-like enzyme